MVRRTPLLIIIALLIASAASECLATGKYCLAFWRETGYYEKGGTGGNHVINIHVWDENGYALSGKDITTNTGTYLGTTDSNGQLELPIYEPNSYSLKVNDSGKLSDVTPGFSSTRAPDWGHYCFECGFMYKSDSNNPGEFDLTYDGVLNSSAGQPCELSAPRTRSLSFYSTKPEMGYYCSDEFAGGGDASSVGQLFKATGNRVVACKVHVRGGFGMRYVARIRENGPTGAYVGASATSPVTGEMEYGKTLTKWAIDDVPVVPGNTYYLEITKYGGGNIGAFRVIHNNYPYGTYYEGGSLYPLYELKGHVCCATAGEVAVGTISGHVQDTGGSPISGALVQTSTGGYSDTTDTYGNYQIDDVAAGTYSVSASRAGYQTATQTNKQVTDGGVTTVNFTLTELSGGVFTGYVRNQSNNPISGATVTTSPGGYSDTTSGDGSYRIEGVPAGTYNLTASASSYLPSTQYNKTVAAGGTTTVSFNLVSSFQGLQNGDFEGGFYDDPDGDHKVANDWHKFVLLASPKHGARYYDSSRVWTQSFYESGWTAGIYQQVLGAAAGHKYTFAADVYGTSTSVQKWIGIDPKGGTNASSSDVQWTSANTTSGSWITLSKQVTAENSTITVFVKGTNGSPVNNELWIDDCALTDDGPTVGTISGTVQDAAGNPIGSASVATNTGGYSTTTAANGTYTLSNVAAGTYNVTASKSGWASQTQYSKQVNAGQTTTVNFSLPDPTAPSTPVVTDDGVYTTSSSSLHAVWSASDAQTGIAEYQYAIGTSPGAADVVGWTSTGTSTGVTRNGLSLNHTSSYYFSVKAKNGDGDWSATGASDGIMSARGVSSIKDAKSYADGECVRVTGTVVTAGFDGAFYIQDANRLSGIAVTGATAAEGSTITVTGVLSSSSGERVITNAVVE